ncbi:MAG: hypothetical protein GDA50_03370, partial [Alphaproteobacteria bacterium GM202ARS2]|nr:hypothetical protein [Alphaproteobacteria bacterium GM202ARS2]
MPLSFPTLPKQYYDVKDSHKNIRLSTTNQLVHDTSKRQSLTNLRASIKGRKVYHIIGDKTPIESKSLLSEKETRLYISIQFNNNLEDALQKKFSTFNKRIDASPLADAQKQALNQRLTDLFTEAQQTIAKTVDANLDINVQRPPQDTPQRTPQRTLQHAEIANINTPLNGATFCKTLFDYSEQLSTTLARADALTNEIPPAIPPKKNRPQTTTTATTSTPSKPPLPPKPSKPPLPPKPPSKPPLPPKTYLPPENRQRK